MARFADSRTGRLCATGYAPGVPTHVSRRAQWHCNLLRAARERRDIDFILGPNRMTGNSPREGTHIYGKWYITFTWNEEIGAAEIRLERLSKPHYQ